MHADHDSEMMAITVPTGSRTDFRCGMSGLHQLALADYERPTRCKSKGSWLGFAAKHG
jgi:hypothetical protein